MAASRVGQRTLRSSSRLLLAIYLLCYTSVVLSSLDPAETTDSTPSVAPLPAAIEDSGSLHLDFHSDNNAVPVFEKVKDTWRLTSVPLPVDNPTKSFWLDTPGANPLADVGSTGKLTEDADVCVIGSGITGVSAAWHLSNILNDESGSKDKTSVVILEARRFCSGATGRNGGHLVPNLFSSFLSRQALYNTSEALKTYLVEHYTAKSILNFINEKSLGDTVDLVEGGHITLFRTEDEEIDARKDYEAAKSASAGSAMQDDMGVRWVGNEELTKKYGLSPQLNFTGVYFGGHNLWPCKVVTGLFQDTQSSESVKIDLHTNTPVTSILPIGNPHVDADLLEQQTPLSSPTSQNTRRRWTLDTPRGEVECSYVIHATNAYAGYLLPFMAETSPPHVCHKPEDGCLAKPFSSHSHHSPLPSPHHHSEFSDLNGRPPVIFPPHRPQPLPPNKHTIVPTRGQVGAVRASVNASELWLNAWDGGAGGWEYWFPRHQDTDTDAGKKNPLIILGGGRQFAKGLEVGVADDSEVNPDVSKALRGFLPWVFPAQFDAVSKTEEAVEDPWKMEWTGIMGFTKSREPFVGPIGPLIEDPSLPGEYYNEGQYIAAGFSGHGMTRASACAEAVAGMVAAKIRGEEWTAPKWLPESYLTWAKKP
ncbi:DAO-domain-containing protein [Pholiota conissans]|uniref:DAO-domain-containing protein n=1 Tax=Pholiota conissans TaxID=109636 RepID=A0A9P5Z5Z8_9AGAR|nr:DAO-domain-containing protein [Pholiota conissans]